MTYNAPQAAPPGAPWLEDRYLDAITLYREIAAAGEGGYHRRHLTPEQRWTEALDLLLGSGLVSEASAPSGRRLGGDRRAVVLRVTHEWQAGDASVAAS